MIPASSWERAIRRVKACLIAFVLAAVFVTAFLVRTETKSIGPDDLQIKEAYLDEQGRMLVLVTADRWAQYTLPPALPAEYKVARFTPEGSSVHWKSFSPGRPPVDLLQSMEPVAVATDKYALFPYLPPELLPFHDSKETVKIPDDFDAALFGTAWEFGQDKKTKFKSYLLATNWRLPSGNFGVQLFYHPDFDRSLVFPPLSEILISFLIYGGSFIALCIALPVAFSSLPKTGTTALFVSAFCLHGWSYLSMRGVIHLAAGWNDMSEARNNAYHFLFWGCVILTALAGIRMIRGVIWRIEQGSFPASTINHDSQHERA